MKRSLSNRISRTLSRGKTPKNFKYGMIYFCLNKVNNISNGTSNTKNFSFDSIEELNEKVNQVVINYYYFEKNLDMVDFIIFKTKKHDPMILTYDDINTKSIEHVNLSLQRGNIYIISNYPEFKSLTVDLNPFIIGFKSIINSINSMDTDELISYIKDCGYNSIESLDNTNLRNTIIIRELDNHYRNSNLKELSD